MAVKETPPSVRIWVSTNHKMHIVRLALVLSLRASAGSADVRRSLRAMKGSLAAEEHRDSEIPGSSQKCAEITNQGSHFSLDMQVGTPQQTLAVVVDTGSRPLVLKSCTCERQGSCKKNEGKCFGVKHSATFSVAGSTKPLVKMDLLHPDAIPVTAINYGSGQVVTAVGSDDVRAGKVSAHMTDSLFLIVDHSLNIPAPDGILGLGAPSTQSFVRSEKVKLLNVSSVLVEGFPTHMASDAEVQEHSFLESAGINRFTMCMNSEHSSMKFNVPPLEAPMTSMGTFHWGLGLWGISVPGSKLVTDVGVICDESSMFSPEQETPCGVIPDTGTTFMMGPQAHVAILMAELCATWPRCHAATKGNVATSLRTFQELLFNCSDWMSETEMDAIPPIEFTLAGKEGEKRKVTLPAHSWIVQSQIDDDYVKSHPDEEVRSLQQFHSLQQLTTSQDRTVCTAALAPDAPMITRTNGPLWLLGLPLFLSHQASFDVTKSPGMISLTDAPCSDCAKSRDLHSHVNSVKSRIRTASSKGRVRHPSDFQGML